ncbi:hypothetical protein EC973_000001 [Apophysomyces ossiformis]|uniref:Uncharacterized protein n=1 Tax=Apophysomyces ossiformis TaxID=679940 RepID=A0A8H7EUA5_9FUNG|nr:hypothetical protein EC973_000001 [Apophysomyces ossiformis]
MSFPGSSNVANSVSSTTNSSTVSSASSTRSLNEEDWENFERKYRDLDPARKWKLGSGIFVEDKMLEFARTCQYEHPAHSLILDLDDPCWGTVFNKEELKMLRAENPKELPTLAEDLERFLDKFSGKTDLDDLCLTAEESGPFDPVAEFDND